ncbi:MAG: exodeoxyribonuclease VII small subunit [Pirellula sp.]|jgi:exodeoxyribonuclease VII small subunit|nr:exodeoxyribonuclease VII small subunit [Pirellula sp.]
MARSKPDLPEETPTFESAMAHLDQIVRKLEGNSLGLDAALVEYAKAVEYVRLCQSQLSGARRKIELLRGITGRGEAITETWEDNESDEN